MSSKSKARTWHHNLNGIFFFPGWSICFSFSPPSLHSLFIYIFFYSQTLHPPYFFYLGLCLLDFLGDSQILFFPLLLLCLCLLRMSPLINYSCIFSVFLPIFSLLPPSCCICTLNCESDWIYFLDFFRHELQLVSYLKNT